MCWVGAAPCLTPCLLAADQRMRVWQVIELKVSAAGGVTWEAADEAQLSSAGGDSKQPKKVMQVAVPKWCGKWAVGMDAFQDGVVGAKSKNIAGKPRPRASDSGHLQPGACRQGAADAALWFGLQGSFMVCR